jgi:hypothetical protein
MISRAEFIRKIAIMSILVYIIFKEMLLHYNNNIIITTINSF